MSDETTEEIEAEDPPSRIAGVCVLLVLSGVAVLILRAVVTAAPYTAYFVAGVLVCLGWQRVRGWIGARRARGESEDEPDVVAALHAVADPHAFLADVAAELGVSTARARRLLEDREIRVRRAVRNGKSTGVGVHKDDIPPLPQPLPEGADTPVDQHNQRPTVEPIGLAGMVVKDGSEAARQHRIG